MLDPVAQPVNLDFVSKAFAKVRLEEARFRGFPLGKLHRATTGPKWCNRLSRRFFGLSSRGSPLTGRQKCEACVHLRREPAERADVELSDTTGGMSRTRERVLELLLDESGASRALEARRRCCLLILPPTALFRMSELDIHDRAMRRACLNQRFDRLLLIVF